MKKQNIKKIDDKFEEKNYENTIKKNFAKYNCKKINFRFI